MNDVLNVFLALFTGYCVGWLGLNIILRMEAWWKRKRDAHKPAPCTMATDACLQLRLRQKLLLEQMRQEKLPLLIDGHKINLAHTDVAETFGRMRPKKLKRVK